MAGPPNGGAGATVTGVDPDTPPLAAVTVASPAATAVSRPSDATVAAAVLFDVQVTGRPVSTSLPDPFTTATSCSVLPAVTAAGFGRTSMLMTEPLVDGLSVPVVHAAALRAIAIVVLYAFSIFEYTP